MLAVWTPARHSPSRLHVTEYIPPFHPSIFMPFFLPFISHPVHYGGRRSFAFVTMDGGEGKGRSGLHLSFASCYHFSHLYLLPTSAPLTPSLLPSLPRFAFDIQLWSREEWVRRGKGGTHARRWTSDPSTPWTLFCCRRTSSLDIQPGCSPVNNCGSFLLLCFASGRKTDGKIMREPATVACRY